MSSEIKKKEELPLVSVIVPCFNHEKFIEECVLSIVNQTYKNIEVIVIDDGSKDNSVVKLRDLQKKHNFILFEQTNQGIAATLNRAIQEYSNGKYISFCASDDFWELHKLEKQVRFMEDHLEYQMCYGKTYYMNTNSKIIGTADKHLKGGWLFDDIFLFKIHPPVNYLFRATIFKKVGYYDEAVLAEDYYMNLKIASKYPIGYINDYLSYYRIDFNKNKIGRINDVVNSQLSIIEEYKNHPLYPKAKHQLYLNKLDWLSGFKQSKLLAITNIINATPMIFNKRYWVALAKLFLSWK